MPPRSCGPITTVRHSTLIVVPAHNEQQRVGEVVEGVLALGLDADLLVVDDGSQDGTGAEARRHGAIVVIHPYNMGYGSALLTGYLYARRHGYPRVVQMDADGQHDPGSIPDLLAALDRGADVAIGSRYLAGNAPPTSWARRLGSRLFSAIATAWTGTTITDSTSGFQAMNETALAVIAHDGFPEDYPDADVLILLARAGCRLVEVPVAMHPRRGGISMHGGSRAAYYGYKMVLTLSLLPWRRRSPFRSSPGPAARTGA